MQGTVQGPTQRAADLRVPNSPDETQAVTLSGNVHSQARPEFDRGIVNAEARLDRMLLLLKQLGQVKLLSREQMMALMRLKEQVAERLHEFAEKIKNS